MKNWPIEIKILSKTYKIKYVEPQPAGIDEDSNNCGICIYADGEIQVRKMKSLDEMRRTLMHEIIHAVLNAICEPEINGNEAFVDRFAHVLICVLGENSMNWVKGDSHE
jgi:hypothetical protein